MDFTSMTVEELELRRAEIATEIDAEGADLDALETEARGIKAELENRKAAEAKKNEIRLTVAAGDGMTIRDLGGNEMTATKTLDEVRASKEYIDAFANYIRTNDDTECRALLTELVTGGSVPVPSIVDGRIRTAWEKTGLLDLVQKTYARGVMRLGFELSATGAVVHTEGADAPSEEELTLGVVTLSPQSIKKWIRISDEALDMGSEELLDYIYDEITYKIAKKVKSELIAAIDAAPSAATATAVGVPEITGAPSDLAIVAKALANLSDEATNPVAVMNRLTHAEFIEAMVEANFRFDPFEGIDVHYANDLDDYTSASSGETWLIVGDFGVGAHMNFPNGDQIKLKYDDLTEAEGDLVKIVGREYVALGLVADKAFCKVVKGS